MRNAVIDVRPIAAGEVRRMRETILGIFGVDLAMDEEAAARGDTSFLALVDLARTAAAFDGDQMVGGSATFDLELAIPGATAHMGGLTMVAVKPSHRRCGILRRFVDAHLEGCRERAQAISALWSSEAPIYGRFGFGPVGDAERIELDARGLSLVPDAGGDEVVLHTDAARTDEARDAAIAIYERVWRTRPGLFARSPAWWQHRIFNLERPGASDRRARMAVTFRAGQPSGFVAYKQFPDLGGPPSGRVEILELMAIDATAEASLWVFLAGIDLFPRVNWWNAPADCLGPWLVADRRRFTRTRIDGLWLRINDVAAAFSARSYVTDGVLTFAIAGEPELWRLASEDGSSVCEPTSGDPELVFDRDALGSVYLGGVSPQTLWRAGRIRGDADAVSRAARLLSWPIAPWCAEVF